MKRILCFCLVVVLIFPFVKIKATAVSEVPAAAAVVVNADTGEVLFSQNGDKRLPMASTTKIMTAILLLENADLKKEITTTKQMVTVEGSSMGLQEGDRVTYETLLYGMMLPSGNDAATTVAISLGGSLEGFSRMMNKKAAELGMDKTHFVTPSGLDSELHYSTALDMAKLAVYAMKNKKFKEVVSTKSVKVEYGNPPYIRSLFGHNKLLENYEWANGIKTGYTSKSGRCLVSSASKDGLNLIAVTLDDSNTVASHKALLEYGFSNLKKYTLELPYEYSKIPVISGTEKYAKLMVDSKTVGLSAAERESLEYEITLKPFVYAGEEEGGKVGSIKFYTKNGLLAELPIILKENIKTLDSKGCFFKVFLNNLISLII